MKKRKIINNITTRIFPKNKKTCNKKRKKEDTIPYEGNEDTTKDKENIIITKEN